MLEKKKILIVEDEAINAMFLKIMVTKVGFEVTGTAATGDAAIESVEHSFPDLILMDITLRNSIDGIEVANILREKHQFPIIFISGYDDKETLNRISLISNTWKLSKPIVENDLTSLIHQVLLN